MANQSMHTLVRNRVALFLTRLKLSLIIKVIYDLIMTYPFQFSSSVPSLSFHAISFPLSHFGFSVFNFSLLTKLTK